MRPATARVWLAVLMLTAGACIPDLDASDAPAPARTADPRATPGGTIRIAVGALDGIDPGNVHEPNGALVVGTFCDTLVAFDPLTAEPLGGLAESWTVTRGGRRLFVKLRAGARFHDGSEVTAEDVVFTLSRVASQEYASASAHLLSPISGYGFVHGDQDTDSARLRRELAGVRAADKRTVEIALDEARADFIRVLGHPATAPVSEAAVRADPDGFERQPVCAGPYRVAAPFERGAPVRLERFADYHGANAAFTAGGRGYADVIEFVPREARAGEARAFGAGRVDLARAPVGARGPNVERAPGGRVEFIGLPTSVAPFDQPRVRAALSMALDRDRIVRRVFDGERLSARSILPPGLAPTPEACEQMLGHDVERAREVLDQSDVDLSRGRVPFYFNSGFGNDALVREVARQWRAAFGMRARPMPMSYQAFLARGRGQPGFDGPFRFGWEAPFPGPEPFLVPLFDDSRIGIDNFSRYDSALFADTLDEARRELDDGVRAEDYAQLASVVCLELPMIPVAVDERAFFVRRARIASAVEHLLDAAAGDPIVRELFVV